LSSLLPHPGLRVRSAHIQAESANHASSHENLPDVGTSIATKRSLAQFCSLLVTGEFIKLLPKDSRV
jgi:hypothetical protein